MSKKGFNVYLDEDVHNEAKRNTDNLSKFVEDCLRMLNESKSETLETLNLKIDLEREKLDSSYNKLTMLEEQRKDFYKQKTELAKMKETVWTNFRKEYNKFKTSKKFDYMDQAVVKEAEDLLGYDKNTLIKIFKFYKNHCNDFNCPVEFAGKWKYVEIEWVNSLNN